MKATRPSDFVQDAATDCSVVASLAAGAARGQRGHTKVAAPPLDPTMFFPVWLTYHTAIILIDVSVRCHKTATSSIA